MVVNFFYTTLIKEVVRRERPDQSDHLKVWVVPATAADGSGLGIGVDVVF